MNTRADAYRDYNSALRIGALTRPAKCERCERECAPHGHHSDYDFPLIVEWLCPQCHAGMWMARIDCTADERYAITFLKHYRGVTESELLRTMLIGDVVAEYERLMARLAAIESEDDAA